MKFENLRIISGIILLASSSTLLLLLFFNPEALAVLFSFGIDITASNLGELIAGLVVGLIVGLLFLIFMSVIGIIYLIGYAVLGILTLVFKRSKVMNIILVIVTSFFLVLEIRALLILVLGGYSSIILTLRLIGDPIVLIISIYSLFKIVQLTKSTK
jgi:hypothetical protein